MQIFEVIKDAPDMLSKIEGIAKVIATSICKRKDNVNFKTNHRN